MPKICMAAYKSYRKLSFNDKTLVVLVILLGEVQYDQDVSRRQYLEIKMEKKYFTCQNRIQWQIDKRYYFLKYFLVLNESLEKWRGYKPVHSVKGPWIKAAERDTRGWTTRVGGEDKGQKKKKEENQHVVLQTKSSPLS